MKPLSEKELFKRIRETIKIEIYPKEFEDLLNLLVSLRTQEAVKKVKERHPFDKEIDKIMGNFNQDIKKVVKLN